MKNKKAKEGEVFNSSNFEGFDPNKFDPDFRKRPGGEQYYQEQMAASEPLPPLTDWQALNVAINTLHVAIHSYHSSSFQRNSDLRQAKAILERMQQEKGR